MKNENVKNITVAVGMSGGVDSTLTAYLLKQKGYNVVGIIMKIWDNSMAVSKPSLKGGCYGPGEEHDIVSAQKAADTIGIPLKIIDLHDEYKQIVLKYFREEYLSGKTPNPCVVCNREMKFGLLLDKALESGIHFDLFATGHYVRVEKNNDTHRCILKCALDPQKDQSYFLYQLRQEQLKRVIFPLGEYLKEDVKKLATEIGFKDFADKPESQDFFEGDDLGDFFKSGEVKPGDIVDIHGKVLGQHKGIVHYTIGKRKGLNIGGLKEPLYVIRMDSCKNQIIVGTQDQLYSKSFIVDGLNWISIPALEQPIQASVKTRVHSKNHSCVISPLENNSVRVIFEEPQMSVTPGQSAVFYDGDVVIGGGIIQNVDELIS